LVFRRQGCVEHATQDQSARTPDLTVTDRLAAQGLGDMLDEEPAQPRMQRCGAPHNLIELTVG
jgi:hypothetical protein